MKRPNGHQLYTMVLELVLCMACLVIETVMTWSDYFGIGGWVFFQGQSARRVRA